MEQKINLKQYIEEFIKGSIKDPRFEKFNEYSFRKSLKSKDENNKYIYNEISLQHELGNYLREVLKENYTIQFERNIYDLGYAKDSYAKKEIDIVIFNKYDKDDNYAIELKYHREKNTRYHDTTADCITDIKFLNQLMNYKKIEEKSNVKNIKKKFRKAYCLAVVDDKGFYANTRAKGWNYWCFRENVIIDEKSIKEVTYSGKNGKKVPISEFIEKGFLPIRFSEEKNNSGWKEICNNSLARYYIVEIDK